MLNWIKNLFSSTTNYAEPIQVDTTTNWPFPTADKPAANDPAPVVEAKPTVVEPTAKKARSPKKPKAKVEVETKKAAPKTASKKPAAIKTKRERKPKSAAGA